MFRINRRTDYAVRVLLALSRRPAGVRLATRKIQAEMLVPRPFLQRIVADLSKARLLETYPGPNGGLQLARPAEQINLREVWEAIEGPLLISECLKAPGKCPLDLGCPVRSRWGRLQSVIVRELENINLAHLATEAGRLEADTPVSPTLEDLLISMP